MNIAEVTKALQDYVSRSEKELEEILRGPVEEYLGVASENTNWFAAIMHAAGSEPDEAIHLATAMEKLDSKELADEVVKQLTGGIISTTLVPAVMPTPLLSSTNQAILSCLRQRAEDS